MSRRKHAGSILQEACSKRAGSRKHRISLCYSMQEAAGSRKQEANQQEACRKQEAPHNPLILLHAGSRKQATVPTGRRAPVGARLRDVGERSINRAK